MIDLTHPCLTLPLISAIGVITSLAGIAVIEGIMKREETDEKVHFLATGKGLFTLLAGVVVLWLVPLGLLFWKPPGGVGEAGDMFGSVTALFSGLAFAGLIAALFTQRQELVTQRKELGLQRKELELSRLEYKLQRFENTLFAMIELFNGYVQSLEAEESTPDGLISFKGREVLMYWSSKLPDQRFIDGNWQGASNQWAWRTKGEQSTGYRNLHGWHLESSLGPYFRLIFSILEHVCEAELVHDGQGEIDVTRNEALRQKYVGVFRAYLSSAEIKLLMFNVAISEPGSMLEWVKKYSFLEHLRGNDAASNPDLVEAFGAPAFGARWSIVWSASEKFRAERSEC